MKNLNAVHTLIPFLVSLTSHNPQQEALLAIHFLSFWNLFRISLEFKQFLQNSVEKLMLDMMLCA